MFASEVAVAAAAAPWGVQTRVLDVWRTGSIGGTKGRIKGTERAHASRPPPPTEKKGQKIVRKKKGCTTAARSGGLVPTCHNWTPRNKIKKQNTHTKQLIGAFYIATMGSRSPSAGLWIHHLSLPHPCQWRAREIWSLRHAVGTSYCSFCKYTKYTKCFWLTDSSSK